MAIITHNQADQAMLQRSIPRIAREVAFRQELRDVTARQGSPYTPPANGYYDENDEFKPFLRLDIDAMNSGRGCA
jgi:hypothetical protein